MALNARQQRLYNDLVDIYVPSSLAVDGTTRRLTTDPKYPSTATYASVTCGFFSTQENPSLVQPIGRSNQDNIFTMDLFKFDAAQDINDTYVIQLKTVGHPQYGQWWIVVGGAEIRTSRGKRTGNYAKVFAKHITKPAGIT